MSKTHAMKILFLLPFFFFFSWGETEVNYYPYYLEKPLYPKGNLSNLQSLEYFFKLVEENHLNVTIVFSKTRYDEDGKNERAIGVTWPLITNVTLNETTIDQVISETFLEKATDDQVAARVFRSKSTQENVEWTNNQFHVPTTQVHKILREIHNGRTGFVWYDRNYISHYTFNVPGGDTTTVIYGDLDIQVIKSENLSDEEVEQIRRLLAAAFLGYSLNDVPEVLVTMLETDLGGGRWGVVADIGVDYFIKATKSIELKLINSYYLIYLV